jgi:hypothetical protein
MERNSHRLPPLEPKSLGHFLFRLDDGSRFQVDHREESFEADLLQRQRQHLANDRRITVAQYRRLRIEVGAESITVNARSGLCPRKARRVRHTSPIHQPARIASRDGDAVRSAIAISTGTQSCNTITELRRQCRSVFAKSRSKYSQ